jgi:hypothetical protein
MNLKYKITEYILNELNLSPHYTFKKLKYEIWRNPRENKIGSMALTKRGFELMCEAKIYHYTLWLEETHLTFENNFVLWLDRNFKYPFYIANRKIFLFDKKPAVELALFSGNLRKYFLAHQKFKETLIS